MADDLQAALLAHSPPPSPFLFSFLRFSPSSHAGMVFLNLCRSARNAMNSRSMLASQAPMRNPWRFTGSTSLLSCEAPVVSKSGLRRLFSVVALRERCYASRSMEKKEPRENGKESKSKDNHSESDKRSDERPLKDMKIELFMLCFLHTVAMFMFGCLHGYNCNKQTKSFEEFVKEVLKPGYVHHIIVTDLTAIVYQKSMNFAVFDDDCGPCSKPLLVEIESAESFTEKLEKAQAILGIAPADYVLVTYASVNGEVWKVQPALNGEECPDLLGWWE